jgi:hypothetical protein
MGRKRCAAGRNRVGRQIYVAGRNRVGRKRCVAGSRVARKGYPLPPCSVFQAVSRALQL